MTDCINEVATGFCKEKGWLHYNTCYGCEKYKCAFGQKDSEKVVDASSNTKSFSDRMEDAKTVLETIKVTARLTRAECEAVDIAIEELETKIDLLTTIRSIKDNVYKQGKRDAIKKYKEKVEFEERWLMDCDAWNAKVSIAFDTLREYAEQLERGFE